MPFRHLAANEDPDIGLSRIIKFGVPGLPMAGHEYLPDREVVALARYVQTLRAAGEQSGAVSSHENPDR
jgi:cytochrome c oxidase cbb3-type subunit 2